MYRKPTILTARTIRNENWISNTTSIYDIYPLLQNRSIPAFIKKYLVNLFIYFNKFDIIIGARLYSNRKNYNVIISARANQAITFSFLSLFNRRNKNIHILEEIYLQEPLEFKRKIRPFVYKLLLRDVDYIRASSTTEIENYSRLLKIDKNKFWFLPYPSPVKHPKITDSEEDYILSAGKQYRDYSTLIEAIKGTGFRLIVVSDLSSMKSVETCDEVTVLYNISKEKYLDLLLKSKFVVVPLNNDFCSCGQIALLEAMSYGKPVITARVVGTIDYIEDGKSGLFYEKGNHKDLQNRIILLNDNMELRKEIARKAIYAIRNKFNLEVFVNEHFKFINEKWREITDQKSRKYKTVTIFQPKDQIKSSK